MLPREQEEVSIYGLIVYLNIIVLDYNRLIQFVFDVWKICYNYFNCFDKLILKLDGSWSLLWVKKAGHQRNSKYLMLAR